MPMTRASTDQCVQFTANRSPSTPNFSREGGYARAHMGMEWGRPLVRNYCTHSRRVLLDITLRKYRLSWGENPCLRAEAPYLICLRSLFWACPKAFPNTPPQAGVSPISATCWACFWRGKALVSMSAVCSGSQQLSTTMVPSCTSSRTQCQRRSMCLERLWN